MKFGDWVKHIRNEQKIDIREFAQKVGVNSSTVSRIENLHTEPTIYTAFRICKGMGVSLFEFLQILDENFVTHPNDLNLMENENVVTLSDVKKLIKFFEEDEKSVSDFLIKGLNDIAEKAYTDKRLVHFLSERKINSYATNDIDLIIFGSPLSYRLELKYPPRLSPDFFEFIYCNKAAFMLHDAERYLDLARPKGKGRLSTFSLASIGTGSAIERVKLNEVLEFDKASEQNGKIVGMYWEAARFYDTFTSSMTSFEEDWKIRLAVAYVTIYRWYQFLNDTDFSWKPDFPNSSS